MERGQPFRITLLDEQLNRWIAARSEIWPGLGDVLPPEIADPVISFQPGRIVLGIRYEGPTINSILSLAINLEMDAARGAILVRIDRLRAGYLPVPRSLVEQHAREALDRAASRHLHSLLRKLWSQAAEFIPMDIPADSAPAQPIPLTAMLGDIWEFRLPAKNRWFNGGFAYTITDLRIEHGKLSIDVQPAPRPEASAPDTF